MRVTWLYSWRSGRLGESFLKTLVATETHHATDPRDRVFALLSHPSATVVTLDQSTELIIEADYRKTAIEIYALLAERLVCTSRCLDVLSYIRGDEKDYGLPTWAPLWSERTKTSACLHDWHIQFAADGNMASDVRITWNLAENQGFKQCEPWINNSGQLCVASIAVGKVSFCSRRASIEHCYQCAGQVDFTRNPPKSDTKDLCLHHGFGLLLEQVNHALPNHAVTRPIETIGEVLTCGFVLAQYEAAVTKDEHTLHFKNYLRDVLRRAVGVASWQAFELPLNYSFGNNPYRIAADCACEGRVLFCTDTGSMGLGPAALRVGDEACVLKGGKVPYILREVTDGHHNLIGECYVSGAMHGELLSKSKFDVSQVTRKIIV
ncbi:hypothetical protein HBI82_084510 [Parastagonospora nodorum]|nr:hypothetical protein HBI00_043000 [Parastagonospora nodorum]KAH4989985.1 hypothetical protein HBI76_065730 [Parastagonospora nodorum]KAH6021409.1 hypothetical protein HBI82_084510 [Parastagonospora nodorum]